jgi:FkbM family methyltransferase
MTICNIGSRKINANDDYSSLGWNIFAPNLTIYGFDADADTCEEANQDIESRQVNWTEKHIPLALHKHIGEATLYVTKSLWCTSLYAPNETYLARFDGLSELMNLDFSVDIETTTLDEFCRDSGIAEIDFLQIDVQGADLDVLQGGSKLLERCKAVQTEVEFSHLYINQPLFADVDVYLRKHGFTLFDLSIATRTRAISPIRSTIRSGQILWGDAFYLRDLIREDINPDLKTPDQILKLACIADIIDFPDYALELLQYLTLQYGNNPKYNFADNIVDVLAKLPVLVEHGLSGLPIIISIRDHISSEVAILNNL